MIRIARDPEINLPRVLSLVSRADCWAYVIMHRWGVKEVECATAVQVCRSFVFTNPVHIVDMELLMLPEELLLSIIASIDDITTLREAATVCKRLNDLVEPYLYQSLIITDGSQAVMLEEAIAKRSFRVSHIRSLLASTRFNKAKGIEHLPGSLAAMRNLRELSLETPDCNQKEPGERIPWIRLQERYERIFQHSSLLLPPQTRSLPSLRSCTSILAAQFLLLSVSY